MAEDIRVPVRGETSQFIRDIESAGNKARVLVKPELDSRGLENFSRPLGKITGQADEFTKSMEAANARVLAFGASVGTINLLSQAFKDLITSTVQVEKSLAEIKSIGNQTFTDLNRVSRGLFSVAKQLGVSYNDAAEATLEFARQGKDLESSLEASRAALALTRTTGLDAAESVKGLTSAINAFGLGAKDYITLVNKMSSVDSQFAVNSKDLIEGISRSASVAQEAGVSFDELTAFITTLQEKTGRGGAVIGNAAKTIFTRIQNPEILKQLKDLGIAVQDTSTGSFLPAIQILRNFAKEFDNLDKNTKNSILLDVGGGFQVDKLSAGVRDLADANSKFSRSLAVSESNIGNVFAKIDQLNNTTQGAFDKLNTSAKELGSNIGRISLSEGLTKRLDSFSSIFDKVNKSFGFDLGEGESVSNGQAIGQGILKGIGNVLTGPALLGFIGVLTVLAAKFVSFTISGVQNFIGLNSKGKEQETIQKSILTALTNNRSLQIDLLNLEGNKAAQAQVLLNAYTATAYQAERLNKLSAGLTIPLIQQGVRSTAGGDITVGGKSITGGASGYIPNLASAISKERSQAPAGSKIIVDNNFPMGGGKNGTMVYNSNESRIKNFRGSGGDAIIPNYPINAADGFIPNFARRLQPVKGGKGMLDIDATKIPLAGILLGGTEKVTSSNGYTLMPHSKPKTLDSNFVKDYKNSPLYDKLIDYDSVQVSNIPIGNVYRDRLKLKGSEDQFKTDFISRLNESLRKPVLDFIASEMKLLDIKPGAGLQGTLENLKTDLIGSSSAGYILEEILKAPSITDAEKYAIYKAQSEKSYFDIYNLDSDVASSYGLPKKNYAYADIKLSEKELYDDLTKKVLNQTVYEGGGTKLKNAANGYIPNFVSENAMAAMERIAQGSDPEAESFRNKLSQLRGSIKFETTKSKSGAKSYVAKLNDKIVGSVDYSDLGSQISLDSATGSSEILQQLLSSFASQNKGKKLSYPSYSENASLVKSILKLKDGADLEEGDLVGIAAKGFVPNFASALSSAVVREKLATGLPSSMIQISKDSRAVNGSLNPGGLIVTNKIDEPNGASSVSNSRMSSAYKNAARGYIPNFSITGAENSGKGGKLFESVQSKLNTGVQVDLASKQIQSSFIDLDNAIKTATKGFNGLGKKITEERTELISKAIQNIGADIFKSEEGLKKLTEALADLGKKGGGLGVLKVEAEKVAKKLQETIKVNIPQTTTTTAVATVSNNTTSTSPAPNVSSANQNENTVTPKTIQKSEKEFSNLAAKLFLATSALSFVSGVLSNFGEELTKVGEAANELGTAFAVGSQLKDIVEATVGQKKEGEKGLLAGGSPLRGAIGAAAGVAGGIFIAAQVISAVDKGWQVFNGTLSNSKHFIDDLNTSFSKYNIQLTDQQKRVAENIVSSSSASGSGISSFANRIGLGSIFKNENEAAVIEALSKTGLTKGANDALLGKAAQLMAPQASEILFKATGKEPTSKAVEDQTTGMLKDQFEAIMFQSRTYDKATTRRITDLTQQKRKLERNNDSDPNELIAVNKELSKIYKDDSLYIQDSAKFQKLLSEFLNASVIPAQDAAIAEQKRQESSLYSSELLKAQLTTYAQISKIAGSVPSILETQLSIEKELLITGESRKLQLDAQIKSLQEQRQTTSDIKDVALSFGREKIDKFLNQISGTLDIRGDIAKNVKSAYSELATTTNEKDALAVVGKIVDIVNKINSNSAQDVKLKQQALDVINTQLDVVKATSAARQIQNAIEAQSTAYLKQQNNEYNIRKEIITNQLTLEQKSVELQKQKLDLSRQSQDIRFETSQIGRPSVRASISQAEKNLLDAQTRPQQDLKNQLAGFDVAKRSTEANFMFEKGFKPERVSEILKLPEDKRYEEIAKTLQTESVNLAELVNRSGEDFLSKVSEAGRIWAEKTGTSSGGITSQISESNLNNFSPQYLNEIKSRILSEQESATVSGQDSSKQQELVNKIDEILTKKSTTSYAPTQQDASLIKDILKGRGPNEVLVSDIQKVNDDAIDRAKKQLEEARSKTSFKGGATEVAQDLQNQIDTFQNTLGKTIPMGFRDGMVSAMKELSNPNSTEPLKNRLLGVANAFLEKINDAFMTNAANKVTNSILGFAGVEAKASGGIIKGGSGSKDDVPAMLMGGEYIISKSAVQKYGPTFLDSLNKGSIKKFADGGYVGFNEVDPTKYRDPSKDNPYGQFRDQGLSFDDSGSVIGMDNYTGSADNKNNALKKAQSDYYAQNAQSGQGGFVTPGQNGAGAIMGQRNLLAFATQQVNNGRNDVIGTSNGVSSVNIGAGSANLSLFALRNKDDSRTQDYLEAKNKAMDLYFGGITAAKEKATKEEEIRVEQERLKEEARTQKRKMYQGLIRQVGMAAATALVSAGVSRMATGGANAVNAAKMDAFNKTGSAELSFGDKFGAYTKGMFTGGTMGGTTAGGLFNSNQTNFQYFSMPGMQGAYTMGKNGPIGVSSYSWEKNKLGTMGSNWTTPNKAGYSFYNRAAGGYVAGNGLGDNVPTMLNGGEFVMSRQATQNIGAGKLQQMNSTAPTTGGEEGGLSAELSAKFDELIEKLNAVGTINISVNSDGKGGTVEKEDSTSDKQGKELARKVKDVVLQVLRDEKRLGGLLR